MATTTEDYGPVREALEADLTARAEADKLLHTGAPTTKAATVEAARQLADRLDYEQTTWRKSAGPTAGLDSSRRRQPTTAQTVAMHKQLQVLLDRLNL